MNKNDKSGVVIVGATSAIARAIACGFASHGYRLILAARDTDENEIIATDVRTRYGVDVFPITFEAMEFDQHASFYDQCVEALGDMPRGMVLCYGYLDDQEKAQMDFSIARKTIDVNFTSAASLMEVFAAQFEKRRTGFLAAISSVAGDRGRQSNYFYGSAKAALSAYLEGLRNRLYHKGVHVVTVKPGYVDTKMTFQMKLPPIADSAEHAGQVITAAILKRRDVVYVPWFWQFIMLIIRHVPEFIFKRAKL